MFRLAHRLGMLGTVRNHSGEVWVEACGESPLLEQFEQCLISEAPRISLPRLLERQYIDIPAPHGFRILPSARDSRAGIHVPPDYFTCEDCLRELHDPSARRYRYPFINCTQCGPRYTIISELPYDRASTSMSGFPMCADCEREYRDPHDRRFHAQPLACPVCGPHPVFSRAGVEFRKDALEHGVRELRAGSILAVRGVGGYHLLCDARNAGAIERLRERKRRPAKPFAIMAPVRGADGADAVREIAMLDDRELALLESPARPILLLDAIPGAVPGGIAPGLSEIGVMLPYSPMHHLLLEDFGDLLVATSGNVSGEPVLTDVGEVEARLGGIADAFLHHDRPIVRPADDPVFRRIGGSMRPLRLGRGTAPLELRLPFEIPEAVVAVGSHMKNTVALAWHDRLVVSPHVGDLDSPRALTVHARVLEDLQRLYCVRATACASDAHKDYGGSRWAEASGLPVSPVFHHRAHASALALEEWDDAPWLMFTWDGVGLGEDGTLWGGETLHGRPGAWERVATFRGFRLPGGELAARAPWRSALGLKWEMGRTLDIEGFPADASLPAANELEVLHQAWSRGLNSPVTSAVGRLFDAAASLTGLLQRASYEGQGPMLLEQAAAAPREAPALPVSRCEGLLVVDWGELIDEMENAGTTVADRASLFHSRLARTLVEIALECRSTYGVDRVGLCGGVFQNRVLVDQAIDLLTSHGFVVRMPKRVPVNDAGIAVGQIVEYACSGR